MKYKFLIILLLKCSLIISQIGRDNLFPNAPEANSLIKSVDVPINLSTGITNYSIPIHNIKLKKLILPITLSYQSSGFKPTEIANSVGLGWELNVGGKITQNVIDRNDLDTHGIVNLPNDRDFKLPKETIDIMLSGSPYNLDSLRGPSTDYSMFERINELQIDTQPDIFYYSIPNKSGKFFFGNDHETKQIPFGKEKIIYNLSNRTFEITDLDGIKYIYSVYTDNTNFTFNSCLGIPSLNGNSRNNSYTFYLSKIMTPDNEVVEFIYDTIKYNLNNDNDYTRYIHALYGGTEKVTSYYSEINSKVLSKIKVNQNYEINFLYNKYRKDLKGVAQLTAPKTLDAIKVKYNNEIDTYNFNYGYFGINESVYNSNTFEGISSNEDTSYRLKLKSFQKIGENPYFFSYHNESAIQKYTTCIDHWGYFSNSCGRYTMNTLFGDSYGALKNPYLEASQSNTLKNIILPTKGELEFTYELNDCFNCDISYPQYYWDVHRVYSNTDDNHSNEWQSNEIFFTVPNDHFSIPFIQFNLFSEGVLTTTNNVQVSLYDDQNHYMNFQYFGIGNQTKPYVGDALIKGKTYRLVLECNDNMENENKFIGFNFLKASYDSSLNNVVGGLRIKNIKLKDLNNLKSYRSFDYNDNGESSGVLYEKPFYFDEYSRFVESDGTLNPYQVGQFDYGVQYSRLPCDLFGYNGYHVIYKKVTETNNDINSPINNIKIEKYFTFYDDLRYGDQTYFSKISYNWKRGLISQINEFKYNDNIRKTLFSYRFLDTEADTYRSREEPGNHINNPTFPNESHRRGLDVNIKRIGSLSFYKIYGYTSSKLISAWYYMDKKTTEENFNGSILKTEEKYKYENPLSAQLTSFNTTNSKGEQLETKYFYPQELITESFMNDLKIANRIGTPIKTENWKNGIKLSEQKTIYAKDATTNNLLLPKNIYSAKFPNTLPALPNGIGSLENKITYNQYDDKGNIQQFTPEKGASTTIIWGYNKTQPIAKIENATYTSIQSYEVNLQTLSNTGTEPNLIIALNTLRANLPNAMVTTYTHKPLVGVSTITDPKGNQITYTYDSFGRLQYVKDKDGNTLSENQYHYKN